MNNNINNRKVNPDADKQRLQARRRAKHDRHQAFLGGFLLFMIFFVTIIVITVICIGCSHNYTEPDDSQDAVTVDYGNGTIEKNASMSTYLVDGAFYINFTELSLRCEMVITGSDTVQTFTYKTDDDREYITFTADSDIAVINGVTVQMPYKALLRTTDMWISADFVENCVNGVTVNYNSNSNILSVKRDEMNASTPQNPIYEKISFIYNNSRPIDTITDNGAASGDVTTSANTAVTADTNVTQTPTYTFKADLDAYEEYMNPKNKDDYLILVNKDNMITDEYVPEKLTLVYGASGTAAKYKMTYVAAMAFEAMVKEAKANGYSVVAKSGYRSYSTQQALVEGYTNQYMSEGLTYEQAYAKTLTDTALPGASEHQTGLTMDVNDIHERFGDTPTGRWLADNSYKFGFILRYPEDKEDITGIVYEPWHFRYVGRYHAEAMYELDMCLEEYVEYLKKNS